MSEHEAVSAVAKAICKAIIERIDRAASPDSTKATGEAG